MSRINRILKLATLAVAVAAAAAVMAGSVQASTIDWDDVPTLGNDSFKFTKGEVFWHLSNGKFSAHLQGTLTMNDANGSCARMRMEYFADNVSIQVRHGGEVCAPDGKKHDYSVDLYPDYYDPDIDLVKVSIEKETASSAPDYSIVESAYVSPNTTADNVLITSQGIDLGGDQFSSITAAPTRDATVYWNRGNGADYTPRLMGYMWLNNVAGLCARMNLRYYTESGSLLTSKAGGSYCAPDNKLHAASVDLDPYTSSQIGKVEVQLQTQGTNGSWNLVGSKTVSIEE
ncbi:MAG TPA: hypothetical protein VGF23_25560 [Gaiellaceae bacterium]|jgi:hypothetical protein